MKTINHKKFQQIDPKLLQQMVGLGKLLTPEQKDEIIADFRESMHKMQDAILNDAFERGLLTKEEYEEKYKDHFYDNYGCDSFLQYLNAAMNSKVDRFLTENHRLLKRRDELEKRFKLKIAGLEEIGKK